MNPHNITNYLIQFNILLKIYSFKIRTASIIFDQVVSPLSVAMYCIHWNWFWLLGADVACNVSTGCFVVNHSPTLRSNKCNTFPLASGVVSHYLLLRLSFRPPRFPRFFRNLEQPEATKHKNHKHLFISMLQHIKRKVLKIQNNVLNWFKKLTKNG